MGAGKPCPLYPFNFFIMSLFKVTSKTLLENDGTPKVLKVDVIDPSVHNHASGIPFTKEILDNIKAQYGADAIVSEDAPKKSGRPFGRKEVAEDTE